MDKPQNHLTEEDDIQFGNMVTLNSSPHSINKNVIDTKLKFDDGHGDYSSRLGINVFVLPLGSYTMAFELIWTSNSVDTNSITLGYAVDNVTVHNMSYKVSSQYARMIIQFIKYGNSDPDHIYVDILIKMKTGSLYPPILQTFMVCYGIKGLHTDIPLSVYDAIWGFDNGKVTFNETIDMNNKDITGVNKITTGNLDVNGQIDVKGNKIIGVGNGTANSDAVNKKQFDDLETQINSEVATVDNKIIQIRNDINTILNSLTKLKYYYFTDQLKHDNANTVKFPAINSYPFSAVDESEFLKIELDGHYQIIYTDFFIRDAQFIIHDDTNGNDLFGIHLDGNPTWTPITINTVIPIIVDNGFNYARIKMYMQKKKTDNEPEFDRKDNS